jgi:hypothetical protein
MITISGASISTIPFQAGTSCANIAVWGQHSSTCRLPFLISIFHTICRILNQPNANTGVLFRYPLDRFLTIANCEINQPGMLMAQKIGQVSCFGCTNTWPNELPSWKLILRILPPITFIHIAINSMTFRACKAHWVPIEVHLTWEMYPKELYTFENIAVV